MMVEGRGQTLAPITQLDRADHIRSDPDALAALMGLRARLLRLDGLLPVFADDGFLSWGSLADADPDAELVFLGLDEDRGCFAAVPRQAAHEERGQVMQALASLHDRQFGIYAGARSLVDWHARHRFCAQCGGRTALAKGGWQRSCVNGGCGAQHFPRVDPVTIMTVENRSDDGSRRLLLGRGLGWPERRYSALAGFVEPGETVEEAVRREVMEEAGLPVGQVRYIVSQAWPMPSQLMLGCAAITFHDRIVVDRTELDDARWFSETEIRDAMSGRDAPFLPPPRHAVAHRLIRAWLDET